MDRFPHRLVVLPLLLALGSCASSPVRDAIEADPAPQDRPYVLVVGTAQDGGCPQIAADHDLAEHAWDHPGARRWVASLLIADPRSGQRWLIDASPDLKEQVRFAREHPFNWKRGPGRPPLFDGIFLTHAHIGHYAGLLQLGREAYGAQSQPTFGSARMCNFLEENAPWSLLVDAEHLVLHTLTPGEAVVLSPGLSIVPLEVPHRAEFTDTLAFRVEGPNAALLYIPDIDKWHLLEPSIESEIAAVDYALLDGTFFADGEVGGRPMAEIPHPFIEESIRRFGPLDPTQRAKIHFTHLNHTNPATTRGGAAEQRVRASGMRIAYDGQVLEL